MEYEVPPSRNPSRDLTLPPESKPETKTAPTTAASPHDDLLRECANTLRKKKALLELSPDSLVELMPYLGDNGPAIVADEIKHSSGRCYEFLLTNRYRHSGTDIRYDVLSEDVQKLATCPGATNEAAQLTCSLFEYHLWYAEKTGRSRKYESMMYVCYVFDDVLRCVLEHKSKANEPWYTNWNPQHLLNRVLGIQKNSTAAIERRASKRGAELKKNPIFPRSMRLLQRSLMRHAQDTGVVLAMKTTGTHLPPELVEMVSDCFYDRELLRTQEADLARRNREAAEAKAAVQDDKVDVISKEKDRAAK